jgi:crotonobetainyl-CoA:carnitine CoA-transferase CaiB-like acyl-CoA transferase
VADIMRSRSTAEWQALLDAADIPNMPMNSPQDLLDDPHLQATGFIRDTEHPTEGRLRTPGNPTRWSHTPCTEAGPAPQLGQHTAQVLREAGYAEHAIQALLAQGISRQSSNTITGQ